MSRQIKVAAAQLGPNQEGTPRSEIVARLLALLEQAIADGVQVVVFPELALTTYFPKRIRDDVDQFFETAMPNGEVARLFERARRAGVAFHLGYAEKTPDGRYFNTAVYVDTGGEIAHKYRKLHLPGEPDQKKAYTGRVHEPYFFEHGDTGLHAFSTEHGRLGMAICQDRRYPETYRALALDDAELILIGYNTPHAPLAHEQHELSMRSGAYLNNVFTIGVAKAGREDGVDLIGDSLVIDPFGQVLARSSGVGDELVSARIDLDQVTAARRRWNFLGRRHPAEYGSLIEPVRVEPTVSRFGKGPDSDA